MNDLWPDFDQIDEEKNCSLTIIKAQARLLGKKFNNRVKATFSKVKYNKTLSGIAGAASVVAALTAATSPKFEEELEDDLRDKEDVSKLLDKEKYKFEIYNDHYRYRLFIYNYSRLYPNEMTIDEDIAKEINEQKEVQIESDQNLTELLQAIFSSDRVRRVIAMILQSEN